jgi:hypothetical protein
VNKKPPACYSGRLKVLFPVHYFNVAGEFIKPLYGVAINALLMIELNRGTELNQSKKKPDLLGLF